MSITFEFKSQFSSEPVFVMCMYFSNTECFLLHFVLIYHPKVSEIFKILIRINKWRHLNRYFKAWDNDNKNSDDILRVATFVILLILINVMQSMFLWGYETLIININRHSHNSKHIWAMANLGNYVLNPFTHMWTIKYSVYRIILILILSTIYGSKEDWISWQAYQCMTVDNSLLFD